MALRSLYLNTTDFLCLFKCLNLTSLPLCFGNDVRLKHYGRFKHNGSDVRFKHLKKYQKPVVFKCRVFIVIYFSHLFLCVYIYIYIYHCHLLFSFVPMCVYIYIYIYIFIYIHVCIYIYIYLYMSNI